ncbi:MAG: hypothetical protein HXN95_10420 [Prevotella salivae]|uniref:hypothetical protein n=1 Tax=Segatella salivae TaxID=228604 RepID=UPI001CB28467|nr:hypothetical protein [Segatella salivae]MBF1522415.1 hypothetical protein [Segatella salivae]
MLQHIKLKIRASQLDSNKHYRLAKVKVIEDTTRTQTGMARGKYLQDIVCHALTLAHGIEISGNERFTYTFPFNL